MTCFPLVRVAWCEWLVGADGAGRPVDQLAERAASAVMASMTCGPVGRREVVGHVVDGEQLGARDQLGGALAAAEADEAVLATVDDERRHVERRQASARGGELTMASSWRTVPSGLGPRS